MAVNGIREERSTVCSVAAEPVCLRGAAFFCAHASIVKCCPCRRRRRSGPTYLEPLHAPGLAAAADALTRATHDDDAAIRHAGKQPRNRTGVDARSRMPRAALGADGEAPGQATDQSATLPPLLWLTRKRIPLAVPGLR
jgi:hypothetical protein